MSRECLAELCFVDYSSCSVEVVKVGGVSELSVIFELQDYICLTTRISKQI